MNRKFTVKKLLFFMTSLSLGILPLHLLKVKPAVAGCGFGDITCKPSEWTCPPGGCGLSRPGNGGTAPSKIPTQVDTRPINGRFIRNTLTGKCIDVAGAPGSVNGAKLQLWDCELSGRNRDNGTPTDQQWALTGGGFIRNTLTGKCIDVAGAPGSANGAPLQLWDCELSGSNRDNGTRTDQQWALTGGGFIRNTLTGKCIDVAGAPGSANGAPLQLWDCELSGRNRDNGTSTDQNWFLN